MARTSYLLKMTSPGRRISKPTWMHLVMVTNQDKYTMIITTPWTPSFSSWKTHPRNIMHTAKGQNRLALRQLDQPIKKPSSTYLLVVVSIAGFFGLYLLCFKDLGFSKTLSFCLSFDKISLKQLSVKLLIIIESK